MVAFVQRPAPAFKAEVVTKNAFSEVSLSDFRGKWWVPGASIFGLGSYSTSQGCPSVLPHVSEPRKRLWISKVLMNLLKGTLHLSARRKYCHGFVGQGIHTWKARFWLLMMPFLNSKPWTHLFSVILSLWVPLVTLTRATPGISTDSKFSHFAWASQSRKEGGLGPNLMLPLITDRNMKISRDYGVLIENEGIALRGLFIIDPQGILRYVKFCLYLETKQPSGGGLFQANHC